MEYQVLQGTHEHICETIEHLAKHGWRLMGPAVALHYPKCKEFWYTATMYKQTE